MADLTTGNALDAILSRQGEFRRFLVSRLGSEADADDVLQNGLLKAMSKATGIRDEQKLTAWFYQVLRNAMLDHIRSRNSAAARESAWVKSAEADADEEMTKVTCRCVESLIDELKPRESDLIRRVELQNESVAEAARTAGISPNNASVTLHRAREKLRERLVAFCGECAGGACLDCDCGEPPATSKDAATGIRPHPENEGRGN